MNILCLMLMTLRHVYSRGAKPKLLDISYWLVPSSRDSDIHWGQCFLVLEAVWLARAALSWDHWNKNSELEHYYQKSHLPRPWDSPGKNIGVGCHFLLQCIKGKSESKVAQSSDSSRPHGLQPTRLLHPWDFPGKNTGVGCHCLLREGMLGSFKR